MPFPCSHTSALSSRIQAWLQTSCPQKGFSWPTYHIINTHGPSYHKTLFSWWHYRDPQFSYLFLFLCCLSHPSGMQIPAVGALSVLFTKVAFYPMFYTQQACRKYLLNSHKLLVRAFTAWHSITPCTLCSCRWKTSLLPVPLKSNRLQGKSCSSNSQRHTPWKPRSEHFLHLFFGLFVCLWP